MVLFNLRSTSMWDYCVNVLITAFTIDFESQKGNNREETKGRLRIKG